MKHPPRCPGKEFTEERQNDTTKERKPKAQKKTNHTEEKPSVHTLKEKTTKHFTEEIDKQERTPTDNTKAPVQGAKAKTCAGTAKTTEQSAEEITKMRPETPKDTTKAPKKTTKEKACREKAKSKVEFAEEATKIQPQTPQDTTKTTIKMTKAKPCAGKAKSPRKFTEEKMWTETPKHTTKACVPQDRCEDKAAVNSVLTTTLQKLKIKRDERSEAAKVVNNIITHIKTHLKENTECFKEVEELRTGSYYENLKVSHFSPSSI